MHSTHKSVLISIDGARPMPFRYDRYYKNPSHGHRPNPRQYLHGTRDSEYREDLFKYENSLRGDAFYEALAQVLSGGLATLGRAVFGKKSPKSPHAKQGQQIEPTGQCIDSRSR